jgi:hypothetical protein
MKLSGYTKPLISLTKNIIISFSFLQLPEFDFGDQTERIIEMLDIMDKSPFFLNYMMSQYIISKYENENILSKELKKNKTGE